MKRKEKKKERKLRKFIAIKHARKPILKEVPEQRKMVTGGN